MRIITILVCIRLCIQAEVPVPDVPEAQKITVEQIIIQTIICQKAITTPQTSHLFGKELVAYLNASHTSDFKELFAKLPLRAKLMYMLSTDIEHYQAFLERYTDDEWSTLWHAAPREEQEHLPRTRTEQLTLIRNAYYTYLVEHRSALFSYFNPKAPYPSDINTFKKMYYTDAHVISPRDDMQGIVADAKKEFIKAYMFRKRLKLFNL